MTTSPDDEIADKDATHALNSVLAAVEFQLDLVHRQLCEMCRTQAVDLFATSRRCFELARMALDELSDRTEHVVLGTVRLRDRIADLERAKPELERLFGLTIELSHDSSESCEAVSDIAVAHQVTRLLLECAAASGARTVRIHYQELTDRVEIVLADDGRGLSSAELRALGFGGPEDVERLGEAVARVRSLIHRAGGVVRWDGRKGVGTWVTIQLHKRALAEEAVPSRWGRSAVPGAISAALKGDPDGETTLKSAGVTHAISNDLAAMGMHLDLIAARMCPKCSSQVDSMLRASRLGLGRARDMIDALHVSPIPSGLGLTPVKERLNELEVALEAMGQAMGLDIQLTREVSDACLILVHRGGARVVSRKLIELSAKSGAKRVHLRARELRDSFEMVFADDGRGMAADELDALGFADIANGPTIKDVMLIRHVLHRVGGTVAWASRQGAGTWVTIRVPKFQAAAGARMVPGA